MKMKKTQCFEKGSIVQIGFLRLKVTGEKIPSIDGGPAEIPLTSLKGDKNYRFSPYHGLYRV